MRTHTMIWTGLAIAALATGCKKGDQDDGKGKAKGGEAAAKADPAKGDGAKAKPPAKAKGPRLPEGRPCTAFGFEGKGDFGDMCRIAGKGPVTIKATGRYRANAFSEELPVLEVTNTLDLDLNWATVSLYYYDAAGNLLEHTGQDGSKFKRWYITGGGFFDVPAGSTTEILVGPAKADEPAGFATVEAEISAFGWNQGDDQRFFRVRTELDDDWTAWETRPRGGWK